MPELPEVEHFKDYFDRTSLHKKINHIICKNRSLFTGSGKDIKGRMFERAQRRGKFLIAPISGSDKKVVFHFGLTGYLIYKKEKDPGEKYAKIIFVFNNGDELQFINKRNFGHIYIVTDLDKIKTIKTMGPEANKISSTAFNQLLQKRAKANIKTFLMDQQNIAGIGNDYSNEILFSSHINPKQTIGSLDATTKRRLYQNMRKVLKEAMHFSISDRKETFPSSWLLAHKKDMKCPKNKNHTLKRISIGGRTAIYCPYDQPLV